MKVSDRAAGTAMVVVGVFGVVVGLIGIVVGRQMVTELERAVDDSLVLTAEALDSVGATIDVARDVVGTVDDGLATIGDVTVEVAESLDATQRVLARVGTATGGQLPDGLERVTGTLPTLVSAAGAIDDALRLLSRAPFGPDYDPDVAFDDALRPLADALTPIPDQLREMSSDLGELAGSAGALRDSIDRLSGDVERVAGDLAEADVLLDRYATTATEARAVAGRTRTDLGGQSDAARLLVTLLGLAFAAGQIVPLWFGRELLTRRRAA
jgi:ABC-type transporter Mla subunit MlaD